MTWAGTPAGRWVQGPRAGRAVLVVLACTLLLVAPFVSSTTAQDGSTTAVQTDGEEEPTFGPPVIPRRLAGPDREGTAAAIATWAHPSGAGRVYLAHREHGFPAALAAGAMADGPTLLVPTGEAPPASVREALDALDPHTVVALGPSEDGVSEATLQALAEGRDPARIAGEDPIATAIALARAGFPDGADVVHLSGVQALSDAMVGGVLGGGPILLVPSSGPVPEAVRQAVADLGAAEVVALGGPDAIAEEVLAAVADGRPIDRLAGGSRFETAAAIARDAFPGIADLVFLARHDLAADAIVGGALQDGPILLVDGCNPDLHPATVAELERLRPEGVVALGGEAAICDAVLDAADAAAHR